MLKIFSIDGEYRGGVSVEIHDCLIGEVNDLLNDLQKPYWIMYFSYTKLIRKVRYSVGIRRSTNTMRKTRATVQFIRMEVTQHTSMYDNKRYSWLI